MSTTSFRLVMLPPQDEVTRSWADRLTKEIPAVDVVVPETIDDATTVMGTAMAAYGSISPRLLGSAPELRWLQAPAAAPPVGYYFQELVDHPVVVTNLRGIYNDHVATHAVALVLALSRNLHRYIPRQAEGEWSPDRRPQAVRHLPESTALIVGLGGIGLEIARLLSVHGVRVLATDARVSRRPGFVAQLRAPDELDRLVPEADFVILTVPHTPDTEGLMGGDRFKSMKNDAYLVNIGRGGTVRLDDLVAALDEGEIAGAALDVFETEPLPPSHPLWSRPDVLLTPHVAATGPYIDERRYRVLRDNADRFAKGVPLQNVVDKAVWF